MEKTCPECGAEVPEFARRCKHCHHDFEESAPKRSGLPVWPGAMLFVLAAAAMLSTRHLASSHVVTQYVFDKETKALIIGQNSKEGLTSDRIPFTDISQIEHVIGGSEALYEMVAVIKNGERLIVRKSRDPIQLEAESIARNIDVPFSNVNNTRIGRD